MSAHRPRSLLLAAQALALAGLTIMLAPTPVQAQETEHIQHASTSCEFLFKGWFPDQQDPARPWDDRYIERNVNGMSHHRPPAPNDDTEHLVCGIDRFNLSNTSGLKDLDVRLYNPPNYQVGPTQVTCILSAWRNDGLQAKYVAMTTPPFEGTHRLDFGGALNQSIAYGTYSLECLMPQHIMMINMLRREY
jgi:hypothetical protein